MRCFRKLRKEKPIGCDCRNLAKTAKKILKSHERMLIKIIRNKFKQFLKERQEEWFVIVGQSLAQATVGLGHLILDRFYGDTHFLCYFLI